MITYPILVAKLVNTCDAWIVGGAAIPDADLTKVKDYDIIVPYHNWRHASLLIPTHARPNRFGGWKCVSEGSLVDVWPDDLSTLFLNSMCRHAWQPKYNIRLAKLPTT